MARELAWRAFGPIALIAVLAHGRTALGADPPARPNILLIMPDQMRGQAMGCAGNPDVKTPNLDRLAAEGVFFTNFIANTPVCCPARATILTGRLAHANGMVCNDLRLRESEVTLAEILQSHGYRTGFIGKWHLDGGRRMPGFIPPGPRRQGFEFWAANQCSHRHFASQYFRDEPEPIAMDAYESEVWTDLAIEFLESIEGRPFFLEVAMGPPHNPYRAPEPWASMYDPSEITLRPNWREGHATREQIAQYYAMVSEVDHQVGRMMKALGRTGLAENTIVLVTSDHGDMLGSQGMRLKRKPWEESIRVPGIMRYPKQPDAGLVSDLLFSHVDIAPTLLGLCGIEPPAAMQGWNLAPRLRGETSEEPAWVALQILTPYEGGGIMKPWRGIRTKTHTYARYEEGPWVLYDNSADPYQKRNLAHLSQSAPLEGRMQGYLEAAFARYDDGWDRNYDAHVEDEGRLYRDMAFYSVEEYLEWAAARGEDVNR